MGVVGLDGGCSVEDVVPVEGTIGDVGFDPNVGLVAITNDGVAMNGKGGEFAYTHYGVIDAMAVDIVDDAIEIGVSAIDLVGVHDEAYVGGSVKTTLNCGARLDDSVVGSAPNGVIEYPFVVGRAWGEVGECYGVADAKVVFGECHYGARIDERTDDDSFFVPAGGVVSCYANFYGVVSTCVEMVLYGTASQDFFGFAIGYLCGEEFPLGMGGIDAVDVVVGNEFYETFVGHFDISTTREDGVNADGWFHVSYVGNQVGDDRFGGVHVRGHLAHEGLLFNSIASIDSKVVEGYLQDRVGLSINADVVVKVCRGGLTITAFVPGVGGKACWSGNGSYG